MAAIHPLSLHNPYLLFGQPIKLVDQGVYLPAFGRDLALEGHLLVRGAGLRELFMQGEHRICQVGHQLGDFCSVSGRIFADLFMTMP
jgi:hypothetical protein